MDRIRLSRRDVLRWSAAGASVVALPRVVHGQDKKILRMRVPQDLEILDPANVGGLTESYTLMAISNKLVVYKAGVDWEWQPDAVEAIEQVDPTHVKFTLRPGIMWRNGFGEMTAEDVKFSFERLRDPALQAGNGADLELLETVEVTDTYSGVLVFKAPFPALWLTVLPRSVGTIVCKKAVEALPEKKFTTEPPTTSGPYMLKEWTPKQKIVLVRNPEWTGKQPDFDEIVMLPIDDPKSAELAFEAGEIDFTDVAVSSVARYRDNPISGAKLSATPLVGIEWVGINVEHPKFQDIRVRQAVQRAIDVEAVIEAAYFGVAQPATGLVAPGILGHRERRLVERDVEAAKKLLAEAGLPDGIDATLSVLNESDQMSAAQVVQANLAEAGIRTEIIPYDSGAFWSLGAEADGDAWKNLQIYLQKWGLPPDPGAMAQWHLPNQIGIWNWERWNSPEFAELYTQGLSEMDPKKRHDTYVRMQDLMEESGAYTFLTNGVQAIIYRDFIEPATTPDQRQIIIPQFRYVGA